MRKLPNCFLRDFTFLPQCLMVLIFHISANIRHFVLILTILLCVWGGLVCELAHTPPPPRLFPQAHILTQSLTVLWWYTESTNIHTWAQSPSPLFSVVTFLKIYSSLKFVSLSFWCAFAPASPSLEPASIFQLEVLWELNSEQWMQSQIYFCGSNSSRM